jgi:hypothetical protein
LDTALRAHWLLAWHGRTMAVHAISKALKVLTLLQMRLLCCGFALWSAIWDVSSG